MVCIWLNLQRVESAGALDWSGHGEGALGSESIDVGDRARGAGDADRCCHKWHLGHHVANQSIAIIFEAHVAVSNNADEHAVVIHYGYAADSIVTAQRIYFTESVFR